MTIGAMSNWVIFLTLVHTILSLVAMLIGFLSVCRRAFGERRDIRETAFLETAVAATVTGFLFPSHGVTPAIVVGLISVAALTGAFVARSKLRHPTRGCLVAFVLSVMVSEYLLCFVAVAQAFGKIPALHRLAPTLNESSFIGAQAMVLVFFIVMWIRSVRRLSMHESVAIV